VELIWRWHAVARAAAAATEQTGYLSFRHTKVRPPVAGADPLDPSHRAMEPGERRLPMLAAADENLAGVADETAPLPAAPSEDMLLVQRVQAGDMAAFEALFHKYKAVIYRTALAITRDAGLAEEVLQDCFYKTYLNIQRIHGDTPLSPWLHRVAVNLSCNALKKRRFWLEPLETLAERLFSDPHHSPEHVVEQSELQGVMRDLINTLPLKHRIVVVLHYLQDFSLPEIAYILNCPVGTVKSRLHYARKVLKTELEARYLAEQGAAQERTGVVRNESALESIT
jgi:RNA polymerase sigma-70 factor, ECF subfamily